jgi:hypothetical protein
VLSSGLRFSQHRLAIESPVDVALVDILAPVDEL